MEVFLDRLQGDPPNNENVRLPEEDDVSSRLIYKAPKEEELLTCIAIRAKRIGILTPILGYSDHHRSAEPALRQWRSADE